MGVLNETGLEALKLFLESHPPHFRKLLDGAVASFSDIKNPVRFTNTANIFREIFRNLFELISPDEEIKRCSWFEPDQESIKKGGNGVTRRHRLLFAIYSFLEPKHFPENFVSGIEDLADEFVLDVKKLNSLTHVTALVLCTPEDEAIAAFDSVIMRLLKLFVAINSAREHLLDDLQCELQQALDDLFTSDFF
jgi:hypothetical protein